MAKRNPHQLDGFLNKNNKIHSNNLKNEKKLRVIYCVKCAHKENLDLISKFMFI